LKVGDAVVTLPLKVAANAAADKVNTIDRVDINLLENLDIDPPSINTNWPREAELQFLIFFEVLAVEL